MQRVPGNLALALVVAAATSSMGCMTTDVTRVYVRSQADVALIDVHGSTVLPPGLGPREAPTEHRTLPMAEKSTAMFTLDASRDARGDIAIQWKAPVPRSEGEIHEVLGSRGLATPASGAPDVMSPWLVKRPTLVLPSCASLAPRREESAFVGYEPVFGGACDDRSAILYSLETPWSNVAQVRRTRRPNRMAAASLAVVSSVVLGVPGAILSTVNTSGSAETPVRMAGGFLVGLALLMDIAMTPTLLARERVTILYPETVRATSP
jgi:hypothetical protein